MSLIPSSLAIVAVVLTPLANAQGPFKAWIHFGDAVPGESTDPGHQGWSDVRTFSASREPGGFSLTCHRSIDKATPRLAAACHDGTLFPRVRLEVSRLVSDGKELNYWELELRNVTIRGLHQTGAADASPEEMLTLDWEWARVTYRVFPDGGTPYPVSRLVSEDSDGDGLPDAYEVLAGLDPAIDNRDLDSDGDGLSDVDEYRLGTAPMDATSFFQATAALGGPADDELTITWPSVSGERYLIEFSADLATPFAPFTTVLATGPETSRTVPREFARGFFRVGRSTAP